MKKAAIAALFAALAPLAAYAAYQGPGSAPAVRTITQAQSAGDDAAFLLEGRLTKKLGHERYLFADQSGEGEVEIDDKRLPGVAFDDKVRVRLSGKVDKAWYGAREVEVKRVELLD
ncbi:YgiW/YdeI family stress tolerance OB fold protein [Crenobacter intestini]|uniref:NirD/YgiW/YdeI family stress tolerance protein n=1 Tax=Crenobacter intestini TaxID=2563443 RepID=A0A4T0UUL6_9NEIS|nr:NirD/YgiW/YdeI family stress tolerance protein [Crenobacter intestini]TIC82366.1 NirD/YgiW/YdeI family stress tolerance protein [Crenobacter intestini]